MPTPLAQQEDTFCTVDLPESWRSALAQGRISVPDTAYLYPDAVAADGSQIFGALYSDAWSGVVAVDRQGAVTRIRAFGNPQEDAITAAFDGRWLVWSETHSITNLGDWDLRAWDSTSGEVFDIAAVPKIRGTPVPQVPAVVPVMSSGRVAWVQANQSGPYELHLYALAKRQDRVISFDKPAFPIQFWGSKLMLVESDVPGARRHLAMADAATGEPAAVPEPLASIFSLGYLTATDNLVAWSEGPSVSIWRVGEPEPTRIFAATREDGPVQWIMIAGDIVTWSGDTRRWVADLRSRSVTPLTEGNGGAYTNGGALLLEKPQGPLVKNGDEHHLSLNHSESNVVDATKLPPLPGCPS